MTNDERRVIGGTGLNWLDWCIAAVFGFFIFQGYHKGFIQQLFEVIGSVVALLAAFKYYHRLGAFLAGQTHLSEVFTNVLGFILIVVLLGGSVSFLGKRWHARRKNEPIAFFDCALGGIFGGFKAAVVLIMLLLILMALPWGFFQDQIGASALSGDLLRLTPYFYSFQDYILPGGFPRMVVSPEGLSLRTPDYSKLKTATCVNCGAKVEYRGMVKQGLLSYPQFVCTKCHRVSDGCLTFEGYHMLKGKCPYEEYQRQGKIDCKVWPNIESSVVRGKCPVCGRTE
jgi:uncharacterized membrane protein required for colicin V production